MGQVRLSPKVAPAMLCLLVVQACTGAPSPSAAPPSPTAPTVVVTTPPEPTPSPTIPPNAAPAELQGRWKTTIAPGDSATLTLGQTTYRISRGPASGSGMIAVDGDVIEFFGANLCPGVIGRYTWAIDGSVLTFTPVGADPCGRTEVLLSEFDRLSS